MAIDWFTVMAQVINFVILVYLLKRFLYRPIINAMQGREQKIAARMAEANEKIHTAEKEAQAYDDKQRKLEDQKQALLSEAREEAQAQRAVLLDELRTEIDQTRTSWHEEVEREKQVFLREVRQTIGQLVCQVARNALTDLAAADLEQAMIRVFILKLQQLTDSEQQALADAGRDNDWRIIIRSSFEVPAALRDELGTVIQAQIAKEAIIQFARNADQLCGITLFTPARKLSWSFDSYLDGIEEPISDALAVTPQGEAMKQDAPHA